MLIIIPAYLTGKKTADCPRNAHPKRAPAKRLFLIICIALTLLTKNAQPAGVTVPPETGVC